MDSVSRKLVTRFFNGTTHASPGQVQEIILSELMYTIKHAQHQSLYGGKKRVNVVKNCSGGDAT